MITFFFVVGIVGMVGLGVSVLMKDVTNGDDLDSITALMLFLAAFGTTGVASAGGGWDGPASVLGGTLAGMVAVLLVGWVLQKLRGIPRNIPSRRMEYYLGKKGFVTSFVPGFSVGVVKVEGENFTARSWTHEDLPLGTLIEVQEIGGLNLLYVTKTGSDN